MELKKHLGFVDVFAISSGAMISSGIFILPGIAFSIVGPGVHLAYMLAGIIAAIGILSVIELSTAMPKAGGNYFFIARSMGPLAGTITGVLSWFALSLKSAFALFGLAELIYLATGLNVHIAGYILLAVFLVLNAVGVDLASRFEVVLVALLLAVLGVYTAYGWTEVESLRFAELFPRGESALLAGAAFVFVSYGGLINVSSISEEVADPKRNIPAGMISSVLCISLLYGAVLYVTVGISDPGELAESVAPLSDAAARIAGPLGFVLISFAAVLAFMTTANAGIMSASRYPVALSRDRLVPPFLGKLSGKKHTPYPALAGTGLLIAVSLSLDLEVLVKAASSVILLNYVLAALSVFILRASRIQSYRPSFKTPLFPLPQLITLIAVGFLLSQLGLEAIEVSLAFVLLSLALYFFYGKRQMKREFALLHLIERASDRKLTDAKLESELVEILHSRDDVVHDRVDELFRNADFIDMEAACKRKELFELAAARFSERTGSDTDGMLHLLEKRESISSTALNSFLAIPHIVCDKSNDFHMLAVRNSRGIDFGPEKQNIHAVFFLAGPMKERNLHLQALSAIAQIAGAKEFEKLWLNASSEEALRHLLLLGGRRRS